MNHALMPAFFREQTSLWKIAYAATLLIPWMLIVSRGGADILCTLTGLLFLYHSYRTREWSWLSDPVIRTGLIAWGWMVLVVSPFAVDPVESFRTALPWIRYLLLYAALTQWVLVPREALKFLGLILGIMLALVCLDTFWQYIFGVSLSGHPISVTGRLSGPMDNVKVGIFAAKILFPTIGLCLFFSMQSRRKIAIAGTLLLLLSTMACIMLSGERTAFLISMLAIVIVTLLLIAADRRYRLAGFGILAVLILGACALFMTQSWVQQRADFLHEQLSEFGDSSYGQLFWTGYQIGKSRPLTGAGFKGFRELCPQYFDAGYVNHCNLHPHNPYIEWFAETGLPGLLLFIAMVALLLRRALMAFYEHSGSGKLVAGAALATLIMHFFPFMGTQSIFSNWPGILLWYTLSVGFASLNLLSGAPRLYSQGAK